MYKKSISELLSMVRNKEIGAYDLCSYFVDRIEKIGLKDGLNAVVDFNPNWKKEALELDNGENNDLPLFGIPYLIKDNIDLVGMPTTAGSLALIDNYPSEDAAIVKKLKKAGAICLGKTNMSELANFLTQGMKNGYSSYGGQVINAYDENADVSGSSSGSAVGACCGLAPFTIGTDTSFSIVGCSNVNGVFGYKPALGSIDNTGVLPISKHLDEVGVMTKRFEDLIVVLNVVLEKKVIVKNRRKIRLAVSNYGINNVFEEQLERYQTILSKVKNVTYIDVAHTENLLELMKRDFSVSLNEYLSNHYSMIKNIGQLYDCYIADPERMMKYGASRIHESLLREVDPNNRIEIGKLVFEQKALKKSFEKLLKEYDAVLMTGSDQSFHFANLPSIAIPIMVEKDGLPKGMILYGTNESKLLSAARFLLKFVKKIDYPSIAIF